MGMLSLASGVGYLLWRIVIGRKFGKNVGVGVQGTLRNVSTLVYAKKSEKIMSLCFKMRLSPWGMVGGSAFGKTFSARRKLFACPSPLCLT